VTPASHAFTSQAFAVRILEDGGGNGDRRNRLSRCTFLLPVRRRMVTSWVFAFDHPRPIDSVHVLLVPRRAIRDLLSLSRSSRLGRQYFAEILRTAGSLVRADARLMENGYALFCNGGDRQEVSQLHVHLTTAAIGRSRHSAAAGSIARDGRYRLSTRGFTRSAV